MPKKRIVCVCVRVRSKEHRFIKINNIATIDHWRLELGRTLKIIQVGESEYDSLLSSKVKKHRFKKLVFLETNDFSKCGTVYCSFEDSYFGKKRDFFYSVIMLNQI